ncbi:hypothetical protein VMF7928_02727 [Vibrio marisflavi CECT 7928]|uniref:Uncharacterized protein n=1 Tax=Vibrio marisflavi CECT 7928 TaxID=634439 RepID=A0ABM9A619_9VIBR|nr:hypothetical protein VMF7928_02727 [Vibrio marisflavi CECT 7928]
MKGTRMTSHTFIDSNQVDTTNKLNFIKLITISKNTPLSGSPLEIVQISQID